MTKRKLRAVLLSVFSVIAITAFALGMLILVPRMSAVADSSPFEATYELGDVVRIPSRTVDVGGTSKQATAIVCLPDGSATRSDEITLRMPGKYTVEYRVSNGGKTYKESYSFVVEYPAYTMTINSDSAEYGTAGTDTPVDGLIVSLTNGGTFTSNKTIDMTDLGKNNPLISFYMLPETIGSYDCSHIYFKLEDAFDADNYLLIQVKQSQYADGVVYVSARAHNQSTFYGTEKGAKGGAICDGMHGFAGYGSFYGTGIGDPDMKISLYYDNETQTVYAARNVYTGGTGYVIDMNNTECFTEGWSGFSSGKVRLSVYASYYKKSSIRFIATEIAGIDISKEIIEINETSDVIVDYGDYTEIDYPEAVVGRPYSIFNATSSELYTNEKIEVNVYTAYGTSAAVNVEVKDGNFVPKSAIEHTIEYRCTDGFGNVSRKIVPVTVRKESTPITINLDNTKITQEAGTTLLVRSAEIFGGEGKLSLKLALVNSGNGSETAITGDSIRLMQTGNFVLRYTVSDYNGQTQTADIPVEVTPSQKPVFPEEPELPRTYIRGARYVVPTLKAEDFSSGSVKYVDVSVAIYVGGKEVVPSNGYFEVPTGDEVVLFFSAKDAAGNTNSISRVVPITETGYGGEIDFAKYFVAENGTVTMDDFGVHLSASGKQDATFSFIRETLGTGFEMNFIVPEGKTSFGSVTILLTDVNDPTISLPITIRKNESGSELVLNGMSYDIQNTFSGGIFYVSLDSNSLTIADKTFNISANLFSGFPSTYVNCDIVLNDVKGNASVIVNSFNRQRMGAGVADDTAPRTVVSGIYGGERNIGDTVEICIVNAFDVLDPYATTKFSVKSPSGKFVTATDGTLLNGVASDRIYSIVMSEYGRYRVAYELSDGNGNTNTFQYTIQCLDKIAPEISLEKAEISGSVGKTITVPNYTVTDNLDPSPFVTIQVMAPNGKLSTLTDNSFVPDKAGKYVIRYLAFDDQYNITIAEVICNVK